MTRQAVDANLARLYLDDPTLAGLLGVSIQRTDRAALGTFYELRDAHGRLEAVVVGTYRGTPAEVLLDDVRREARAIVRAGMAAVTPLRLRLRHVDERTADELLDRLAGIRRPPV